MWRASIVRLGRLGRLGLFGLFTMVAVVAPGELGWVASLQTTSPASGQDSLDDPQAEAYYLFLLGRHLEGENDIAGVIDAFERAAELDLESADILSELGAMYARQNRADEAILAAERALQRDADSTEAHRILGMIHAGFAEGRSIGRTRPRDLEPPAGHANTAIDHLERARMSELPDLGVLLQLGRLYLSTRAYDDAIEVLTELLDEQPGVNQAVQLLSRAYDGAGRPADAVAVLEAESEHSPSARTLLQLAERYEQDSRWMDAAGAYERAIEQNPRQVAPRRRLATALSNAGETTRARDVLLEVVELRPTDLAGLYQLSNVEFRLNNLDAAEAVAERLVAAEPNGVRGPVALAQVFERRREYRRVVETLEPAVGAARNGDLSPRQIGGLLARIGFAYQELDEFDQAIAALEAAVELSPSDLSFELQLGQTLVVARRFPEALEVVRGAQERHSDNLSLSRLEAQALSGDGELDEAVSVLRSALEIHPDEPFAYVALANLYGDADQFDEAQRILEAADERVPGNESILFQLGAVSERQQQYADAERRFRQVLAGDPQHAGALNYLGYMLADRGVRLEESVALLWRAIAIDPHNGAFLDSLGWAYFKLNQFALAEPHLQQASDQLRSNSVVQDHLGDLMYELRRYREAIAAWERALAGDGEEINPATIEGKIRDASARVDR